VADDPRELLVVVDEHDRVLAHRTRGEVHADRSLLHRSVAVVVETAGGTLWQRRGFEKDIDPGGWDLACTGHVDAADADADAAVRRELGEELGVEGVEPRLVGRLLVDLPDERELVAVYRLEHPGPFRLLLPELSGLVVLPPGERPTPLSEFAERVLGWLEDGAPAG
jgi:8-oxo-dGTP pyrophosphatase MutT (NUDIX family)